VPSRWENFPYACVEAMSSGLPVLATRQGGMPEMIRDGQTGWLADHPSGEHLVQTLRRALETSPDVMAEMGSRASEEIEQICSSSLVLEKQIEFRNRIALHPATRSFHSPIPDSRLDQHVRKDDLRPGFLVERTGWLSPSPARNRRTGQAGLKLIDVFNLACQNPSFFFKMAVRVFRQVKKRASLTGLGPISSQLGRWLGWEERFWHD
jgi:hypothetical protein